MMNLVNSTFHRNADGQTDRHKANRTYKRAFNAIIASRQPQYRPIPSRLRNRSPLLAAGFHAEPMPDRPGYFAIKSCFRSRSVSVALNSAGFSSMSQWPTPSIMR